MLFKTPDIPFLLFVSIDRISAESIFMISVFLAIKSSDLPLLRYSNPDDIINKVSNSDAEPKAMYRNLIISFS